MVNLKFYLSVDKEVIFATPLNELDEELMIIGNCQEITENCLLDWLQSKWEGCEFRKYYYDETFVMDIPLWEDIQEA